ncbi:aconitase iron-sulfur domain-containing protein [Hymenopellis radicata]|nr:aconitase iron-sulfur domain-containing protein [Hymenopellis radicata]
MAGIPWELKCPKVIGVNLTGKISGWTTLKDVILKVAGILTVKGGTGMATICNMGAEIGATTSMFPFNNRMVDYLNATKHQDIANYAKQFAYNLKADENAEYDQVIDINGWPEELKVGLIGSCTNSSYEDMSRSASIAKEAAAHGLEAKSKFTITLIAVFETLVESCLLMLVDLASVNGIERTFPSTANSIITSYNCNFTDVTTLTPPPTLSSRPPTSLPFAMFFTVILLATNFLPLLRPRSEYLPSSSCRPLQRQRRRGSQVRHLQLLSPFKPWDGKTPTDLPILIKAQGKCNHGSHQCWWPMVEVPRTSPEHLS